MIQNISKYTSKSRITLQVEGGKISTIYKLHIYTRIVYINVLLYTSSGQETDINGRRDRLRWPRDTLYPQKLAQTSLTSGGRSVGIVRLRTKGRGVLVLYTSLGYVRSGKVRLD
jgi:hypothetical protein